ncbi:helix-turn-helix transcriptional regulator [Roseateles sp. DAIF2]|uniref:AraC family transcriptional regulator n=1 Tax=Roseateles sp. DAIF2 TaxID=2714952 RepID=UPI0018A2552B|nr:helix-turn-helix transcriptional regulator [Roseateles sp. DAIF2]QPF74084.1 helix-turn-helix transcriptional regulator [Roseateles sp. DAIF2]
MKPAPSSARSQRELDEPPPLRFKLVHLRAGSADPPDRHEEGQFVHAIAGVLEVGMDQRFFLAPPQYGVWIPPGMEHVSSNRHEASYVTLYVARSLCEALPRRACTMAVNPLILALLDTLRRQAIELPRNPQEQRLFQVLLDQLSATPSHDSYLPMSQDPLLSQVLNALQARPWDARSLADWAALVHTTERTLARRCQRDLDMSFNEWRQRLKVVRGIALLERGRAVKEVALELGYSAPSAFIAMFQRQIGMTPQAYLRKKCQ